MRSYYDGNITIHELLLTQYSHMFCKKLNSDKGDDVTKQIQNIFNQQFYVPLVDIRNKRIRIPDDHLTLPDGWHFEDFVKYISEGTQTFYADNKELDYKDQWTILNDKYKALNTQKQPLKRHATGQGIKELRQKCRILDQKCKYLNTKLDRVKNYLNNLSDDDMNSEVKKEIENIMGQTFTNIDLLQNNEMDEDLNDVSVDKNESD